MARPLRICFVTGTRAEFGLMRTTLEAIRAHPKLRLQIAVTGMHLAPSRGGSVDAIAAGGWTIDRVSPWDAGTARSASATARATGNAVAGLADAFDSLRTDVVLVVGDRAEAFAAASAAHISGRVLAHVHGGDRAAGQTDDALRHAITKLAHVHFAATAESAARIARLGEDRWRIRRVGTPGIDGIRREAAGIQQAEFAVRKHRFALVVLHPADADEAVERRRAAMLLDAVRSVEFDRIVIVYPNNDPGSEGIAAEWAARKRRCDERLIIRRDIARPAFLGLLRDAAVLVGNSSSGIIEAASFGTPVVDVGPRQKGRERSGNVVNVPYDAAALCTAVRRIWRNGHPRRWRGRNVYGGARTGARIADALAGLTIDARLLRKLIAY